jgi:RNA polymerase sigma factor (sigma-70 family)
LQKQDLEKQFEQHVREHEPLLHKICRIYAYTDADRQDLFQEIVIQLWKAYPKFRGDAKFSTWLYRIAINTAISGLRKRKDFITTYEPSTLPIHHFDDTTSHTTEEQLSRLYKAIEQLSEVEKAIVMLYMEDRTYEDMEDILGISQPTLRVKMSRIKEKIRQLTQAHQ